MFQDTARLRLSSGFIGNFSKFFRSSMVGLFVTKDLGSNTTQDNDWDGKNVSKMEKEWKASISKHPKIIFLMLYEGYIM